MTSKPADTRVVVPAAEDMYMQMFRLHCQKRHPRLGFYSPNDHALDHVLHDAEIDHVHAPEVK